MLVLVMATRSPSLRLDIFQGCNRIDYPCTANVLGLRNSCIECGVCGVCWRIPRCNLMDQYRCSNLRKRRSADTLYKFWTIMHGLQKCPQVTSLGDNTNIVPRGGEFLMADYSALYTKYGLSYGRAHDLIREYTALK